MNRRISRYICSIKLYAAILWGNIKSKLPFEQKWIHLGPESDLFKYFLEFIKQMELHITCD